MLPDTRPIKLRTIHRGDVRATVLEVSVTLRLYEKNRATTPHLADVGFPRGARSASLRLILARPVVNSARPFQVCARRSLKIARLRLEEAGKPWPRGGGPKGRKERLRRRRRRRKTTRGREDSAEPLKEKARLEGCAVAEEQRRWRSGRRNRSLAGCETGDEQKSKRALRTSR